MLSFLFNILRVLVPFFAVISAAAPSGSVPRVKLSFGLEPADPSLLERTLHEVSDPLSPRYGQHLTCEQARALIAPRDDSADAVKSWLADAGVSPDQISQDGRWVHTHVPKELAKRIMPSGDSSRMKRSLPARVSEHVALIYHSPDSEAGQSYRRDLRNGNSPLKTRSSEGSGIDKQKSDLSNCYRVTSPTCLREWYNIPMKQQKPAKGNLLGFVGFLEQTAQHAELEEFQRRFDPLSSGGNFSTQGINGGENPQETPDQQYPSGEANMNVQYTVALSYDIPVRYYPVGGKKTDYIPDLDIIKDDDNLGRAVEPFLELAQGLMDLEDKDLPLVVSISWGSNEQHYQKEYAKEACNLFGQLGTRGVSVITAAGNSGPGVSCQSNDGKNSIRFIPVFPASCPYVTTVGGTRLESNTSAAGRTGKSIAAEFSGGGFSDYFDRPKWQDKPVKDYLKKYGKKWEKYYSEKGRAYPDVAAHAGPDNSPLMNHGIVEYSGGTSLATPVFASMITLINNQRLKDKKPPMGFLNPWLYKVGSEAFTDITKGKSVGCEGESYEGLPSPVIPGAGWEAVKGWDPITGWGTPKFDKLKKEACD